MTTMTTTPENARAAMVQRIHATWPSLAARTAEVMRAVPRHRFVPDANLADAYADIAVITHRAEDGSALSCASVPTIVAMMLDRLDAQPGHNILEIGAGTGYNAALLADLVGPTGQVTTIDVDPQITADARGNLDATGYQQVRVLTGDGAAGAANHAPFDRIIVTVGPWDIPPAWPQQLTQGGRMVVPLRWRGSSRCLTFDHHDDRLVGAAVDMCGFVPMRGPGQDGEHRAPIHEQLSVVWDADQDINATALRGVLDQPRQEAWADVLVAADEPYDGVWLRLMATEPGTCALAAGRDPLDPHLYAPAMGWRNPALADTGSRHGSLAYLTLRPAGDQHRRYELGAIGHGPAGADLAEHLCAQIRAWNTNRAWTPTITAAPADNPTGELGAGLIIDKPATQLSIA